MPLPPLFFLTVQLPTLLAIWWRTRFHAEPTHPTPAKNPRSIIIFRLDGLGDLVLTTPLFRELKRLYPKARCTVVVQEPFRSLLTTNPSIHEVLTLPSIAAPVPRQLRTLLSAGLFYWKYLRGRQFDLAVSPRWDTDEDLATLLCVLTNASARVGYTAATSAAKQRLNRGFDSAFSVCLPAGPLQHEVLRNLAVVTALGGEVKSQTLDIHVSEQDRSRVAQWWPLLPPGTKVVALGIGARHLSRQWPLERYSHVISQLSRKFRLQLIILCAPAERPLAIEFARQLGNGALLAPTTPRESCAVLQRCHLFIGNDSGSAHLAAASGCDTLVISRHPLRGDPNHPNSPVRFAPLGDAVRVLQPHRALPGCETACRSLLPHCITTISVAEVTAAAEMLLRDSPVQPVQPDCKLQRRTRAHLVTPPAAVPMAGVRPAPSG